jgi:hypothetical protein
MSSLVFDLGCLLTFYLGLPYIVIFLPLPPSSWDYRCEALWPARVMES